MPSERGERVAVFSTQEAEGYAKQFGVHLTTLRGIERTVLAALPSAAPGEAREPWQTLDADDGISSGHDLCRYAATAWRHLVEFREARAPMVLVEMEARRLARLTHIIGDRSIAGKMRTEDYAPLFPPEHSAAPPVSALPTVVALANRAFDEGLRGQRICRECREVVLALASAPTISSAPANGGTE